MNVLNKKKLVKQIPDDLKVDNILHSKIVSALILKNEVHINIQVKIGGFSHGPSKSLVVKLANVKLKMYAHLFNADKNIADKIKLFRLLRDIKDK